MRKVMFALAAGAFITAGVSVSANAGGGAHNRCGSTWELCAQRGKASPVTARQTQQYQPPICDRKKGCR